MVSITNSMYFFDLCLHPFFVFVFINACCVEKDSCVIRAHDTECGTHDVESYANFHGRNIQIPSAL